MKPKPLFVEPSADQSTSRGADVRELTVVRDRAREIADEQAKACRNELAVVADRESALEQELAQTRELDALARALEAANRDKAMRLALQDLAIGLGSYLLVSMFLSEER